MAIIDRARALLALLLFALNTTQHSQSFASAHEKSFILAGTIIMISK